MILSTPRTLVRELTLDDVAPLAAIYADAEVMRFVTGKPMTEAETRAQIERQLASYKTSLGFGLWAVVRQSDQRLLGRAGLMVQYVEGRPETEVGYLLERAAWGSGLATEVALAIRDHARQARGMTRLIALIQPENEGSKKVARKLGMEREREVAFRGKAVELFSSSA